MQDTASNDSTAIEDCRLDLEKAAEERNADGGRLTRVGRQIRTAWSRWCPQIPQKGDPIQLEFKPQIRSIDQAASGYPRLAALVDSDRNFMIFRRFGYLRTRLILNQQDVLRSLEQSLDGVDKADGRVSDRQRLLCSRELDEDQAQPVRRVLFEDIALELEIYDKLLLRTAAVLKLTEPDARNKQSIFGFIWNDGQLRWPDRDYILHDDDLVGLSGDKEHSWVHSLIERLCTRHGQRLSKVLFRNRIQDIKTSDPALGVNLYASSRFDRIVAVLFTMLIIALLMAPVFVLCGLGGRSGYIQNAVTLGFTTFFALLCSTCTTAKRHEIFAATAAYCAVLVVFTSPKG